MCSELFRNNCLRGAKYKMAESRSEIDPPYADVFEESVRTPDDNLRLTLLTSTWEKVHVFQFPSRFQAGRYRKLQSHYFISNTWLRYSKAADGVYCGPCYFFAPKEDETKNLTTHPLKDWSNVSKLIGNHAKSSIHISSLEAAENFIGVMKGEKKDISCSISSAYNAAVEKNRQILVGIVDTVIQLGKQGLPFRGDDDAKSNFISLLNYQAKYNPVMKEHLCNGDPRTKYTSAETQNELIDICGDLIKAEIVRKCNQSFCFGFIADEATDAATIEQMAICIRFYDDATHSIREDFLQFAECESTTGESLSEAFIEQLNAAGIDISRMRGQGYDGAANMSGKYRVVQARIKQILPDAAYTHCKAHCLNLAIINASKERFARIMMDKIQEIAFAFNYSGKRHLKFQETLKDDPVSRDEMDRRTKLQSLCETRWAARADALYTFLSAFRTVVAALGELAAGGDTKAATHRNAILSFDFIITLVSIEHILSSCVPLSQLLQRKSCDLVEAVTEAHVLSTQMTEERNDKLVWEALYDKSVALAQDMDVDPTNKRSVSGRAQHRPNAPALTISEYWRVNMYLPFVDHLVSELDTRLIQEGERFKAQFLLPKRVPSLTDQHIQEIHSAFASDVTENLEQFTLEIHRWKLRCDVINTDEPTDSLAESASLANVDLYPNVRACLCVLAAMPVATATAERSFSTMRRVKTYLRSTMSTKRLSGLGLLNIYREQELDSQEIVDIFARRKERRMALLFKV